MSKQELIEQVRAAQAKATQGKRVNAESTLKGYSKAQLEEMLASFATEEPEAPAAEAKTEEQGDRPLNRKQCNARLAELGYTGPTSYLMPVLRDIVAYVEAGYPEEQREAMPNAVLASLA